VADRACQNVAPHRAHRWSPVPFESELFRGISYACPGAVPTAPAPLRDRLRAVIETALMDSGTAESEFCVGKAEHDASQAERDEAEAVRDLLLDRLDAARRLIREFTDPDPCWFDHHGGCQAHGYLTLQPGELCPHAEAKRDWLTEDQTPTALAEGTEP
jgi:microcystin degradation protein MlrC